ncbi:hypothetical protein AVEN_119137-1 [Araneus ventricosus]|uniref:Synaptonemal complex protein 2 Spt16M-like domain-containing protein n=1 Tax=Araneus ventricosus TaxID=182803 RepID=A0A4Y2BL14_ARAVE|nr:hypothetical protein AVEN_119137-1 [Araneus ventricosus]
MSLWCQLQLEFLPQTQYDVPQPYTEQAVFPLSSAKWPPEPGLFEAVPSLDHCRQQSCTVDTFLPSLSAISQKENPPSRSPTTRSRSNSAVYNLNILLKEDGPVLKWLRNQESLEGFLLILGRKLPIVGDFECQSHIFETLCYIVYNNENKHKWIQSWFTDDEKTRSMFLNWDLEHFTVESRKILNQINRRELNPRTYAFAATAVYFGNVQLKKLNGLEFWIDFNYDSESISFFCKDFEAEDQDTVECWETVVIPSDSVESYSVQKKEDIKSIELCIALNCSCNNLLLSPTPLFESTNLVRMIFWIYVDISSHLRVIFGEPVTLANNHDVNSQGSQHTRKVSLSLDVFGVRDQDNTAAAGKIRKISASDVVKIQAEDYCEKKKRRISDSAELVCLSDDACNFHITNTVHKSHDSCQKRKVSCGSLFLKESESERSFQMDGKNKHPRFKFVQTNSTEKHSKNNEKLTNEEDERDTNRHCHKERSSQIFRSERKSSDASCATGYRSDDSDFLIIDTDDREEGRFEEISECLLKEKLEIAHEKPSDDPRTIPESFIENKNMNLTEEVSRLKFQKFVQDVGIEESFSNESKKPLQPIKTETGLSFKDSHIIRNSNESVKLSQKDKKSISSEGSQSSQKRIKKVDGPKKVSQSFSDEAYAISPTPANRKKSSKTAMLTPNNLKSHNSSEAQSYFANHADASEYEKNISHKTIFDEDTEDFKNLDSSQSKNAKGDTPNSRQKKIRLYNINRDPVYDVPPSEQKKVNATPIQKNSPPFVDLSLKNQNNGLLLSSLPLSDEDFCETKIFRKKSTDSLETKKKHNIKNNIICEASDKNDKNKLSGNNFLEKGQLKDHEDKLSRQDTSENELHLSDKDAASSEPRRKRSKKNSDEVVKRKSSTSRLSKRKPNDVEKEVISDKTPPKKRRKAAIKAMEKNKTMLEQKELGTTEGFSEKSSNINHSNDEIEVFCTPPTKPVKKRRLKSVFLTDTETGSSNVSWIGEKNSCLFETPQKQYSKRMKSRQASKSTSPKKKTYKSTIGNSKKKQKSNFSMNGFEIKSKSGLSDLENYELVVERKTDHKKSSNLSRKRFSFESVSKAINAAMEGMVNEQYFDNELNKESNNLNIESSMYDNLQGFDYGRDLHTDESKVKEDLITTERNLTNISRKGFKSNVADEQNMVPMKSKPSSSEERHSRTGQSLCRERDVSSIPEVHPKSVSNGLPLSNSVKKRKSDDLSASKRKAKRNRKDSNNLQGFILGSVTHTNDDFDAQDSITHDETSQNTPSTVAAQIPEFPKTSEKDKNNFSSTSKKATETHLHPTSLSPKVGILTEQSLSSLVSENDEAAGKEFHMQRFLEDLSGESNSPKHFECADNIDQAVTSRSNKTSKSNISSRSGDLLEHSTSEKHLTEEIKISKLSSGKKKHFTSFEESNERSKASSEKDLQKFSLLDIHSDSGLQESFERYMKEDNHQKITKINGKKSSKQLSVLHILGVATDNMTHILLKTLQKHFHSFNVKISASREKMLATANALISKENDFNHKDLKNIAKAYKMNRIQAEKSLNQILLVGQEYFEAEKKLDRKMKRLHKKALKKYAARIKLAGRYAVEALEDRAAAKMELLLKSILKKLEHL